jgi:MFS family permease
MEKTSESEEAKRPTRFFGLSRNIISMATVSFLNDLSSEMIYPFLSVFITSTLGASASFLGLIEGIADATASILKIFSGRISDVVGRRKIFVVSGYSLSAVMKPILSVATAPWHVLVVRFLDRVGKGTRDAPRDALVSVSAERRYLGRAFGFHRSADTLGATIGPLVAFAILPLIGNDLRTLFLFSFVASFFAVVIAQVFIREIKPGRETTHHEDGSRRPLISKADFLSLGAPFFIFLFATTVFSLGRASDVFLLLRAQHIGVSLALLPLVYSAYNITFALFSTPAGALSDRIGHRNTFMIGMLMFSGSYLLLARTTSVTSLVLIFVLYGFYSALTDGVGRAIVADLIEERLRASAYGLYSAANGIALLPGSFIFGVLWDQWGAATAFTYGATLGILAVGIFLFLRVKNHRR